MIPQPIPEPPFDLERIARKLKINPANPITCFVLKFHKKTAGAIRKRCCMYKEELMMAAWAPRRIQRWLDMGYDLDLMDAL